MHRWVVFILFAVLAVKLVSGGLMVSMPHGMDMGSCEGVACGVATDQCLKHCLAASQTHTTLPAVTPSVFLLVVSALVTLFAAVALTTRSHGRATGLAPPGLAFVRNTILRE